MSAATLSNLFCDMYENCRQTDTKKQKMPRMIYSLFCVICKRPLPHGTQYNNISWCEKVNYIYVCSTVISFQIERKIFSITYVLLLLLPFIVMCAILFFRWGHQTNVRTHWCIDLVNCTFLGAYWLSIIYDVRGHLLAGYVWILGIAFQRCHSIDCMSSIPLDGKSVFSTLLRRIILRYCWWMKSSLFTHIACCDLSYRKQFLLTIRVQIQIFPIRSFELNNNIFVNKYAQSLSCPHVELSSNLNKIWWQPYFKYIRKKNIYRTHGEQHFIKSIPCVWRGIQGPMHMPCIRYIAYVQAHVAHCYTCPINECAVVERIFSESIDWQFAADR